VANVVKTSLGPTGLDKLLVDDIGDVTITNDGATILSQLAVEHAAARVLVDLATLQDKEVGDGTTSVVLIAAALLEKGNALIVGQGWHPTAVLSGYRQALKTAVAYIKSDLLVPVSDLGHEHLMQAARTSMSSKIIGKEGDFFATLAVQAVQSVTRQKQQKTVVPLSNIHILKAHGQSSLESQLLKGGFALAASRAAQGMPLSVHGGVQILCLDMNLQRHRMGMGVSIQVKDAAEVTHIQQRELDIVKDKVDLMVAAGIRVVLTTKGMDDVCLKYFVQAGILCARRVPKADLQRLCQAVGGSVLSTLADMEGNESIDETALGFCESVSEVRLGDGHVLQFDGITDGKSSTIVLRGANEYMLDEMDRALHDALCVVKRMVESKTLVAGGGAVEVALAVHLQRTAVAQTLEESRHQVAFQQFAQALLVIPRQLAVNAALDATELVAQLRAVHNSSNATNNHYQGLDLVNGTIRDNLAAGVVEPALSKIKSLRFATEAALTILRIDDRITVAE